MNRIAKGGVAMLLVATVLLGSLAAALADEPQPEIYIPKMRHDFGDVYEQQTFEYSFVVRNKGKDRHTARCPQQRADDRNSKETSSHGQECTTGTGLRQTPGRCEGAGCGEKDL